MEFSKKFSGRKRKADEQFLSPITQICILHSDKSSNECFTFLSEVQNSSERLKYLHDIRELRLSQPPDSKHRMESICDLIPSSIEPGHGYHRDCYQYFTNHVDRLKKTEPVAGASTESRLKHRRLSGDNIALFTKDCIFCNKESSIAVKKSGSWTTEGTQKFKSGAWKTVVECAELKQDESLLVRIRGCDLFASEAHFHPSCRKKYVIEQGIQGKSSDSESKLYQKKLEEAHNSAFNEVCMRVSGEIINQEKVLNLNDLVKTYITLLEKTEFANAQYRSEKLKAKLEARFKEQIAFCKLDKKRKFESQLVYNAKMKLETAVKSAYVLGSKNILTESALYLRQVILDAFDKADELRWPPTVEAIGNTENVIPKALEEFLKYVFSGKIEDTSTQANRLVCSVGQDMCRAVTNGEWKLPKHILIAMTLRHLYRSKQLTTLLNRLGHSESHAFGIELETAIANALEETSSLLTNQIVRQPDVPSIFHSEFDNFDQLVNTLRGTDSIHTAHGIMMQDLNVKESVDPGGTKPVMPEVPRTKDHTINVQVQPELPDCYVGQRKSPSNSFRNKTYPGSKGSVDVSNDQDTAWTLLRNDKSSEGQEIPGWTGFVSVTGKQPVKLTTIDYYPVINHPITEYKTVQECLRYAEEATSEVGQTYTVTTFDLGVCMKAYPIIWNNPNRYKKHIVLIGTFHLICAYMKMVGKKMAGSGLSDIMLEAGLIGTGSILGVMTGKHYERAMHCHKVLLESLERLLVEQFLLADGTEKAFDGLPESSKEKLERLSAVPSEKSLDEALKDGNVRTYIKKYASFKQNVRDGKLGKTAKFWMSYMDHIWLVLTLLKAVKINMFLLYADSLCKMASLFFSFDGQNYARYLTFFSAFIANLEESHPGATELLKRGGMSVARSFIPGNRCAVDKTMEETFMKHAKSHSGTGGSGAGISGISGNYNAYQRWIRTSHERSKYVEATLNMADMMSDSSSGTRHRELRPTEILKGDAEVCETVDAIKGFVNPFNIDDKERLYCVSSGAVIPVANENDILLAEVRGREAKELFISERLEKKDKFFEPIKRLNLKTMEDTGKAVKVKSLNNRSVQYKQLSNVAMQLLVQSQKPGVQMDLAEMLRYPLTPVPFSIGTADGFLAKTDKSKGFRHVIEGIDLAEVPPKDETLLVIEDGNALFHSMKDIPSNFKQISEKLFNMMPQKADIIFSTDMYIEGSVKSMERTRRGSGDRLLIQGENTKKPAEWKSFLANEDNKKQLVQVMCKAWSNNLYAKRLHGRNVTLICEGIAYQFTSSDGQTTEKTSIDILSSTQEETDTRVVYYCLYGKEQGYRNIQVRSPDSDIFFILLYYIDMLDGCNILFDTGTGNKRKLIDMDEVASSLTEDYRSALLGLHAFCGCDSTSAFKGKGHIMPIKTMQKRPKIVNTIAQLGTSWSVSEELIQGLEEFTCAMYGNHRFTSVDDLRLFKIKEKCDDKPTDASRNIDLAVLPPCRRCLVQHIKRVNYQVGIWKRSHIADPDIPPASEAHGWTRDENGDIEPLWIEGDIVPPQMVDVLVKNAITELTDDDDENNDESDEDLYELMDD